MPSNIPCIYGGMRGVWDGGWTMGHGGWAILWRVVVGPQEVSNSQGNATFHLLKQDNCEENNVLAT